MRIFVIIGTRPEAIKMLPLVLELKKYSQFEVKICFSGQHGEIAKSVFDEFEIVPDYVFDAMKKGQGLAELTSRLLKYFDMLFRRTKPDLVLVHGDTTTALCGAIAAYYLGIGLAHVEAGLRTFDAFSPFPEEFNRVSIDAMSNIHFAPTNAAADNLVREGRKSVFTVYNTVIDAIKFSLSRRIELPIMKEAGNSKIVLITNHRRENLVDKMQSALLGIRDVLENKNDLFGVMPCHPNPRVREVAEGVFRNIKNIKICPPLPMIEFHNLLSRSFAVFTDSGGIQEEAAWLGIPLFLMRDNTERPECVELGNVCVVGTKREDVRNKFLALMNNPEKMNKMRKPSLVFGDGTASKKIAKCLLNLQETE